MLDCLWQILQQFPTYFEFTAYFIELLLQCLHSGFFVTFRGNCERDRIYMKRKLMSLELIHYHQPSTIHTRVESSSGIHEEDEHAMLFSSVSIYLHYLLQTPTYASMLYNGNYQVPRSFERQLLYIRPRFNTLDIKVWSQGIYGLNANTLEVITGNVQGCHQEEAQAITDDLFARYRNYLALHFPELSTISQQKLEILLQQGYASSYPCSAYHPRQQSTLFPLHTQSSLYTSTSPSFIEEKNLSLLRSNNHNNNNSMNNNNIPLLKKKYSTKAVTSTVSAATTLTADSIADSNSPTSPVGQRLTQMLAPYEEQQRLIASKMIQRWWKAKQMAHKALVAYGFLRAKKVEKAVVKTVAKVAVQPSAHNSTRFSAGPLAPVQPPPPPPPPSPGSRPVSQYSKASIHPPPPPPPPSPGSRPVSQYSKASSHLPPNTIEEEVDLPFVRSAERQLPQQIQEESDLYEGNDEPIDEPDMDVQAEEKDNESNLVSTVEDEVDEDESCITGTTPTVYEATLPDEKMKQYRRIFYYLASSHVKSLQQLQLQVYAARSIFIRDILEKIIIDIVDEESHLAYAMKNTQEMIKLEEERIRKANKKHATNAQHYLHHTTNPLAATSKQLGKLFMKNIMGKGSNSGGDQATAVTAGTDNDKKEKKKKKNKLSSLMKKDKERHILTHIDGFDPTAAQVENTPTAVATTPPSLLAPVAISVATTASRSEDDVMGGSRTGGGGGDEVADDDDDEPVDEDDETLADATMGGETPRETPFSSPRASQRPVKQSRSTTSILDDMEEDDNDEPTEANEVDEMDEENERRGSLLMMKMQINKQQRRRVSSAAAGGGGNGYETSTIGTTSQRMTLSSEDDTIEYLETLATAGAMRRASHILEISQIYGKETQIAGGSGLGMMIGGNKGNRGGGGVGVAGGGVIGNVGSSYDEEIDMMDDDLLAFGQTAGILTAMKKKQKHSQNSDSHSRPNPIIAIGHGRQVAEEGEEDGHGAEEEDDEGEDNNASGQLCPSVPTATTPKVSFASRLFGGFKR